MLERLREVDPVAAVRFASVYLGFDDLSDFEREIKALSQAHRAQAPLTRSVSASAHPAAEQLAVGLEEPAELEAPWLGAAGRGCRARRRRPPAAARR